MTAVIMNDSKIEEFQNKFASLIDETDYKEIYEAKQGTISIKSVNDRIRIATSILK